MCVYVVCVYGMWYVCVYVVCLFVCLCTANGGKTGGGKDSSSRSHRNRVEMKRTSSEGKAFDLDEPVMEAPRQESCKHPKAKTYVRMRIKKKRLLKLKKLINNLIIFNIYI